MTLNKKLADVIHKYRSHPEFLGIDVTDVNQPGAVDDTLLHIAARKGAIEDVEVLVSAGASVNMRGDLGYTPLHAAAMGGHLKSVRKLLQAGADPFLKNEFEQTPADLAESLKNGEAARLLRRYMEKVGVQGTKRKGKHV